MPCEERERERERENERTGERGESKETSQLVNLVTSTLALVQGLTTICLVVRTIETVTPFCH